jgi:hypothetical protein
MQKISFLDYLKEDGEVTTGDIAGVRTKLKKKKTKRIFEDSAEFSTKDVISKLGDAERRNELKNNSVVYGIEDEGGNITKVYISQEQDQEFKKALSDALAGNGQDVSEILFDLRHSFDILFVDWPKLPEDEEVENKLEKPEGEQPDGEQPDGPPTDQPEMGADQGAMPGAPKEGELPPPTQDQTDSQGMLLKVIDMLRADAEAKAAEANARAKEAEAEQAKSSLNLTNAKAKTEEDMLRAEDYYKKQQESKKEDDRLAKLAKYRNEVSLNTMGESIEELLGALSEDIGLDISRIQTQIADLNARKQRAMKVYDDQLRNLQNQLAQKQKMNQMEQQRTANQPQ